MKLGVAGSKLLWGIGKKQTRREEVWRLVKVIMSDPSAPEPQKKDFCPEWTEVIVSRPNDGAFKADFIAFLLIKPYLETFLNECQADLVKNISYPLSGSKP